MVETKGQRIKPEKQDAGPVFQLGALYAGTGIVLLLVHNIWLSVGAVGVSLILFARGVTVLWKR